MQLITGGASISVKIDVLDSVRCDFCFNKWHKYRLRNVSHDVMKSFICLVLKVSAIKICKYLLDNNIAGSDNGMNLLIINNYLN